MEETNVHCIFFCQEVIHIWFGSPLGFMSMLWTNGELNMCSLFENVKMCTIKEYEATILATFSSLDYCIWLDRNNVVFQGAKPQNAISIIQKACFSFTLDSHIIEPRCSNSMCIQDIFREYSFIIVDGGFIEQIDDYKGSFGFCAYKGKGYFLLLGTEKSQSKTGKEGELDAIYEALRVAFHFGLKRIFVLSYNLVCISAIKGTKFTLHWSLKDKVKELELLCSEFKVSLFEHVNRMHLAAAHSLATEAMYVILKFAKILLKSGTLSDFLVFEEDPRLLHNHSQYNSGICS